MHPTWKYLIEWVGVMAQKHGGIVYDGPHPLDWGQAMCRETFGPDWMTAPDFISFDNTPVSEPAPALVVELCRRWEQEGHPAWVTKVIR